MVNFLFARSAEKFRVNDPVTSSEKRKNKLMAQIFCDSLVRFLAKPNFTTFPRNSHQHQHLRHFCSCCCCQCVLLLINDGHCSLQEAATAAVPGFCNPRLSRLTTRGEFSRKSSAIFGKKIRSRKFSPNRRKIFSLFGSTSLIHFRGFRWQQLFRVSVRRCDRSCRHFLLEGKKQSYQRRSIYQFQSLFIFCCWYLFISVSLTGFRSLTQ